MTQAEAENTPKSWKEFLRKHWQMAVLFIITAASAAIGAVYVFLWFAGNAQSSGLVPTTLSQWTMAHMFTFVLNMVFWEFVLIGIPVIIASLAGWLWWRRLSYDERREYHLFDPPSRKPSNGGGAASLLFWIAFSIRVYMDGNWNVAIATWTLDYLIYTSVWTVIWMLIIFGIPATIIGIIWLVTHQKG
jgi:hypothetical protein